ncbi:MAG: glycoside hydrolase family 31 protein [Anaerolineaceae bacterium]|nr:glycoside hydrolase family 31 protein [Anaerolineaceae bacterium]
MTPSADPRLPTLHHQPYGEQHPYEPLPCERFPRDPSAGDPVMLGVETGHIPTVDTVWCTWQAEGHPLVHRTEGVKCVDNETADLWRVQLPAFTGGDVIRYRLFARSAERQVESEEYTFSVSAWIDVGSIVAVEDKVERLVVRLATNRPGVYVRLQAEPGASEMILLRLSAFSENPMNPVGVSAHGPLTATWGDLRIILQGNPLRLALERQSDSLILQSVDRLQVLVRADGVVLQYRFGFESPSTEAFYGFGERFNALDQRGNHLDNHVYGQYTTQGKRSYIPIPFFISSRGYGLWLDTERQAEFDLAAADSHCWTLTGHAEEEEACLEVKFFFHQTPREIIRAFAALTGKPKLPPSWVFGLWMSSNDWNSQAGVLRQLQLTQEYQIPATVLVIEAWSDESNFYIWNDAQYHQKPSAEAYSLSEFDFPPEGRWPDPKVMIDELHQAGLRLVLWQNPAIKFCETREHLDDTLNQADQAYAIQEGYVVRRADGSPHRVEAHMPWFGNSLVLDFTNPKAAEWWFQKRDYLVSEMGVDGFKTDGGEHIWDIETQFHNGMRGSRGINYYPLAYEQAYRRFMEAHRGTDHVLFSRAGYTGAQQAPCHWAGDENSTWEAFRASLRAMLNVSLCGIPFMGWDIAGFAGPIPSSELYVRAAAFSVFCPIMQYHSDVNGQRKPSRDRTPWNIQEQTGDLDIIPIFRKFANLRMNLLPYILNQAHASSRSGLPLMRMLALEYPKDVECRKFPYEYLFGDALLVAPVMEEGVSAWPVYLPEGEWWDFWTGEMYNGPALIEVQAPRDRIPVFQKKGSIIPLHLDPSGELGSPVGNGIDKFAQLTLRVFPGGSIENAIFQSTDAVPGLFSVEMSADGGKIEVQAPPLEQGVDLVIFGPEPASVTVAGTELPKLDSGLIPASVSGWHWNSEKREIRIRMPESDQPTQIIMR